MIQYYAQRAPEYDALYARPERQKALTALSERLCELFQGKNVLEIACGTGYWTQQTARCAQRVHATDINDSMLDIARKKPYPMQNVSFENADMYALQPGGDFNALFGGFIWSHIRLEELDAWLEHLHGLLSPHSRVAFADNRFVTGSSTPISATDESGNTFQNRLLKDGSMHSILKNFPMEAQCLQLLKGRSANIRFEQLEHYWLLHYETTQHSVPLPRLSNHIR